jgi:hypothetical protein
MPSWVSGADTMPNSDPYDDAIAGFASRKAELGVGADRQVERFRTLVGRLKTPRLARLQEAREDLIRRIVPVAISVGFAAFLVNMHWLREVSIPNPLEWEQLARLFTALLVILLGWDWYHRDTDKYPATTLPRFIVDVLVVIASLIFLISSAHERVWLLSLIAIFVLYVIWDCLTYHQQFKAFITSIPKGKWTRLQSARAILNSYKSNEGERDKIRSLLTNVSWLIYFIGIFGLDFLFQYPAWERALVPCFFVAWGAVLLWRDGNNERSGDAHGWTMKKRCSAIGLLWALFFVVLWFTHAISTPSQVQVTAAQIANGRMVIAGRAGRPNVEVYVDNISTPSDASGYFRIEAAHLPGTCIATVSDGTSSYDAVIANCGPQGVQGLQGSRGEARPQGKRQSAPALLWTAEE